MIYIATPLFSIAERKFATKLVDKIESQGHEVYFPVRDAGDDFYKKIYTEENDLWRQSIFSENKSAIDRSSFIIAILDGADVESGVSWEIGYAFSIGKKVIGLRTDFRTHSSHDSFVNLMIEQSLEKSFIKKKDLLIFLNQTDRLDLIIENDSSTFYNNVASEYDDENLHPNTNYIKKEANKLGVKLVPEEKAFEMSLEIGGGSSSFIEKIKTKNAMVIDPSNELLKLRKDSNHIASLPFHIGDFNAPNHSFDLVSSILSIDHINNLDSFFKDTHRIMRKDGHLILVFQNPVEEIKNRIKPNYFKFYSFKDKINYLVRSEMENLTNLNKLIINNKFRIIETQTHKSQKYKSASLTGIHCIAV